MKDCAQLTTAHEHLALSVVLGSSVTFLDIKRGREIEKKEGRERRAGWESE